EDATNNKKNKKKIVSLLAEHDQKKHYNVSIGLSRLKKSNFVIHDAILGMDENELKLDTLLKLQKYVPEESEQELFRNWDGDSNDLDIPDQFFFALKDIPFLQERLSLWIFKIQFPELFDDNNRKVALLQKAHDIVKYFFFFFFSLPLSIVVMIYFALIVTHTCVEITNRSKNYVVRLGGRNFARGNSTFCFVLFFFFKISFQKKKKKNCICLYETSTNQTVDKNQLETDIKDLGKRLDDLSKRLKSEGTKEKEDDDKEESSHQDLFADAMGEFYKNAYPKYSSLEKGFKKAMESIQALG
ncbi:hypothetical protein RFI_07328, partial [Reticulomyxa filosa]